MVLGFFLLLAIIIYYVFIRPANGNITFLIWGSFFLILIVLSCIGIPVLISLVIALIVVAYFSIKTMHKLGK